jgi:putative MATE family efflux protein
MIMHVSNIFLNYALIYGNFGFPELGVTGAAIGTAGSSVIGVAIYFYLGFKHARKSGFCKTLPNKEEMKTLVRVSIPNGIQQTFFAAGWVALYAIIGKVGTSELAAANVLINVMLVAILPSIGMGIAAATLVGQALGRKDPDDAFQWGLDVTKVGIVLLSFLGAIMAIFPEFIIGIFIHDAETIKIATHPMRLSGYFMPFEAIGLILMNSLLGAGDSKKVMKTSILIQWAYFLPAAYIIGVTLNNGLLEIWICNGSYRIAAAALFAYFWYQKGWTKIKL